MMLRLHVEAFDMELIWSLLVHYVCSMNHTKQDQDFKKWLVLEVVCSTKTIGNELQCSCDRTHIAYNEEFILVTNCTVILLASCI